MVRPLTKALVDAIWNDVWPSMATVVDFGLVDQEHYEALYYPVREREITAEQLDKALGNGPELTRLARGARHNPHKSVVFTTPYDFMPDDEE